MPLDGPKEGLRVVVLEAGDGEAWYVRVGKWEQALERRAGEWWVGRWEGGRERVCIGEGAEALVRVEEGWTAQEGQEVLIGGRTWFVREYS